MTPTPDPAALPPPVGDAPRPARRVERVRYELQRRELSVARVEPLGSAFVRVVLTGDALAGFESRGFDDHVKLLFDEAATPPVRRDYTPRAFDAAARELTLDFALHDAGAATGWARAARPGQTLTIGGPRGSLVVPVDYDWHLLVGDATALPAIARRLEEVPAQAPVRVFVLAGDDGTLAALGPAGERRRGDVQRVADPDALLAAVAAWVPPAGEGYVWGAGEAAAMARLRDLVLDTKRHPREAARIAAYWKRGVGDYHADLVERPR